MKLEELMTTDVVTISPEATLKEAARRMIEAGVSGLPVTEDDGRLVGIITEADFVHAEAGRRVRKRAGLLGFLFRGERLPSEERNVGDMMTTDLVVLGPEADHPEAARLMEKAGVKRIPVVDGDGRLVGILSRSDLLRAFARTDAEIIDEVLNHVARKVLWIDPERFEISCVDGNVVLSGHLEFYSDAALLVELTRRVDGVISVADRLTYDVDNRKVEIPSPPAEPPRRDW